MGMIINTNFSSLRAQSQLNNTTNQFKQSLERLSSGSRINGAKDDAAGLAIANRMHAQVRGVTRAVQNASDATSLLQTSDGSLNEVNGRLQRMRELTVQAMNETNSDADRESIQVELDALVKEIDLAGEATFNGKALFGDQYDFFIGASNDQSPGFSLNTKKLSSDRLGLHSRITSAGGVDSSTALANGDLTIVTQKGQEVAVRATSTVDDQKSSTNQDGSAIAKAAAINSGTRLHGVSAEVGETRLQGAVISSVQVLDADDSLTINGQSISGIRVEENDASGSLIDAINAVSEDTGVTAHQNGAGNIILTAEDGRNIAIEATGNGANLGFTDGTVQGATLTLSSQEEYSLKFATSSINTSALGQLVASTNLTSHSVVSTGGHNNSTGYTPNDPAVSAWNATLSQNVTITGGSYTGFDDFYFEADDINVPPSPLINYFEIFNFDASTGQPTGGLIATLDFSSGDGTYTSSDGNFTLTIGNTSSISTDGTTSANSFVIQGGGQVGNGSVEAFISKNYDDTGLINLSVLTTQDAQRSLQVIDVAIDQVSQSRVVVGTTMSRIEHSIQSLNQSSLSLSQSKSQIMDADISVEMARLSSAQIIQQASVLTLAQANISPQLVLNLLS